MHWNGLKSDLKHLLKHKFGGRGLICKNKTHKSMKTLKTGQKQAIEFDRQRKNAKHRFHQQTYYTLRNKGALQYQLITNHLSQNFFH